MLHTLYDFVCPMKKEAYILDRNLEKVGFVHLQNSLRKSVTIVLSLDGVYTISIILPDFSKVCYKVTI